MEKVYVVAILGVETYCIDCICASEETARKRFSSLKLRMIGEQLQATVSEASEYQKKKGEYKDFSDKESARQVKFCMKSIRDYIEILDNCKFDRCVRSVHVKPVCDIYNLEP